MDIVIYQKLETGKELEHTRSKTWKQKLPYPVASTMFLLLFFFSSAGLREAEIDWKTYRGEMGREKM
jgi:hypothetical protein